MSTLAEGVDELQRAATLRAEAMQKIAAHLEELRAMPTIERVTLVARVVAYAPEYHDLFMRYLEVLECQSAVSP